MDNINSPLLLFVGTICMTLFLICGCSNQEDRTNNPQKPLFDASNTDVVFESPEEVFEAYTNALASGDIRKKIHCLSPEGQQKETALAITLTSSLASKGFHYELKQDQIEAELKSANVDSADFTKEKKMAGIYQKHGLSLEDIKGLNLYSPDDDVINVLHKIDNKPDFVFETYWLYTNSSNEENNMPKQPAFKNSKLVELKFEGDDSATGYCVVKHDNEESKEPMYFEKTKDSWKILLDRPHQEPTLNE